MPATPDSGLVGIGNMGWPMAARLLGAGFSVRAFDARREHMDAFNRDFD